jgi:hypothetical protein
VDAGVANCIDGPLDEFAELRRVAERSPRMHDELVGQPFRHAVTRRWIRIAGARRGHSEALEAHLLRQQFH